MGSGTRQGKKTARFVHRLAKIAQVAIEADQIQEIAMLARARGVGPFAGRTRTESGPVSRT